MHWIGFGERAQSSVRIAPYSRPSTFVLSGGGSATICFLSVTPMLGCPVLLHPSANTSLVLILYRCHDPCRPSRSLDRSPGVFSLVRANPFRIEPSCVPCPEAGTTPRSLYRIQCVRASTYSVPPDGSMADYRPVDLAALGNLGGRTEDRLEPTSAAPTWPGAI